MAGSRSRKTVQEAVAPPTTFGKVKEFHQKHRIQQFRIEKARAVEEMDRSELQKEVLFLRTVILRMRLMAEEMGETFVALHERDEEQVADGLADLDYVTAGTAIALDLPHDAIVEEVHRSNMTKSPLNSNAKGGKIQKDGWQPPNIRGTIARHRR